MSMHGYADKSSCKDMIEMLHQAEVNGANMYYVLAYLAKEKGYDDVYEVLMANAAEDAFHGGRYGAMLGKGASDEAGFWKLLVNFYQAEAGAGSKLKALAAKVRATGEEALAVEIEASIEEEEHHAQRLANVLAAHGVAFEK